MRLFFFPKLYFFCTFGAQTRKTDGLTQLLQPFRGIYWRWNPTGPFTTLELQNPSRDVLELSKIWWSPYVEALKLRKGRSGSRFELEDGMGALNKYLVQRSVGQYLNISPPLFYLNLCVILSRVQKISTSSCPSQIPLTFLIRYTDKKKKNILVPFHQPLQITQKDINIPALTQKIKIIFWGDHKWRINSCFTPDFVISVQLTSGTTTLWFLVYFLFYKPWNKFANIFVQQRFAKMGLGKKRGEVDLHHWSGKFTNAFFPSSHRPFKQVGADGIKSVKWGFPGAITISNALFAMTQGLSCKMRASAR